MTVRDGSTLDITPATQKFQVRARAPAREPIGKDDDADTLADLRRRVLHHKLFMKEQNMCQLEARLKSSAT
jgi:hypothetical protein